MGIRNQQRQRAVGLLFCVAAKESRRSRNRLLLCSLTTVWNPGMANSPAKVFFFCYSGYINRIYDAVRLLLDHPAANREGKRGISLNAVAKYSMIKAKQPNVIVVLKISQCKY